MSTNSLSTVFTEPFELGPSRSLARNLLTLTKPSITRMVGITMVSGALAAQGPIPWLTLAIAILGTVLVVSGANTLNMVWERKTDALMTRTKARPLPTGQLSPRVALWFGLSISVLGLLMLSAWVGLLTAGLAAFALVSYVCVYTPLKRVTPLALQVGAIPGAIPPVLGYTAVTQVLDAKAWVLFAILFLWQIPHFLAISIFRKSEYERAGIRVLSVVKGKHYTTISVVLHSVLLLVGSLTPLLVGMGGPVYAVIALVFGNLFMAWALVGLRAKSVDNWARSLFFASMPYLVALMGTLVAVNL